MLVYSITLPIQEEGRRRYVWKIPLLFCYDILNNKNAALILSRQALKCSQIQWLI